MHFLSMRARAFGHAFRGIYSFWFSGIHPRIMFGAAGITIAAGFLLQLMIWEWVTIILTCGLVLVTEAINSALEYLVDLCSPQYHPLAKKCKDIAAGASLMASIAALSVALLIIFPKIWNML